MAVKAHSEPGGYIQWNELDCATFQACALNEAVSKQSSSELLARYISSLADIFVSNHLEVIDSFRLPVTDNLRRASTDNFIMALEEIGAIASAINVDLLGTSEEFKAFWKRAVMETEKGVSIGMEMIAIAGRKPDVPQRS
ncbi:MAG: hypothetical protein M1830_001375 [Pleopsidium flavum]|nr:MAG: hypothetical protein M1830_001375 [Pleopsidium flavum]